MNAATIAARSKRAAAVLAVGACLLPSSAIDAQENRLGRLFYTPEERANLDQKRGVVAPVQTGPQSAIVNGIVTRSGRAPIVFIDGKEAVQPGGNGPAIQAQQQGVLFRTESGQTVGAKPGQIVDLANGRAMESFQRAPRVADPSAGADPATDAALPKDSRAPVGAARPAPGRSR